MCKTFPSFVLGLSRCANPSPRSFGGHRDEQNLSLVRFGPIAMRKTFPSFVLVPSRCAKPFPCSFWGYRDVQNLPLVRFGAIAMCKTFPSFVLGLSRCAKLSKIFLNRQNASEKIIQFRLEPITNPAQASRSYGVAQQKK